MSPSDAPDRAPSHALVTGGTGLIGRHTAAHLAELGWRVTVTGRGGRPADLPAPIDYRSCDLLDHDARAKLVRDAKADVLVHLAWVTEHGRFWTAPENLDWVGASLGLARQFVEAGGRRIVAAGTCVEYRPPDQGPCVPGETALEPQFLYAAAKDAYRRALEAYARQSGAAVAWGRVFLLIGPGEAPGRLVPTIVRNLLAERPAECSSGVQVRDFLDVRDCGRAFANLAMSAYEGSVNVSTGVPRTIGDVARTTARLLGRSDLLRMGALRDRPGEPHNLWGDATALRDYCGFEPGYTLEQTLEAAIAYWRKQGAGNVDTNRGAMMKMTIDEARGTLVVEAGEGGARKELPLYSDEAFSELAKIYVKVNWNQKYSYTFSWLGRPIIQLPDDLVRIQEVIARVEPDVIIETGVAHGGSLILYASLCEAMGKGRIVGVDIEIRPHNRKAIEEHRMSRRISLIEGSSIAPETVAEVRSHIKPGDRVLVILDSNHLFDHVLRELELYSPMVTVDSYIVATDGIMSEVAYTPRGVPSWTTDNPTRAAEVFAAANPGFVIEQPTPGFNEGTAIDTITYWPKAYLRRAV